MHTRFYHHAYASEINARINPMISRLIICAEVPRERKPPHPGFLTVLEDAAGKQSAMDMAPNSASLAEIQKQGVRASTSFPVPPPGSYRVREVVREVAQNRVSVSTARIDIR
jgi:hypothetical protein